MKSFLNMYVSVYIYFYKIRPDRQICNTFLNNKNFQLTRHWYKIHIKRLLELSINSFKVTSNRILHVKKHFIKLYIKYKKKEKEIKIMKRNKCNNLFVVKAITETGCEALN